jgi:hypothetical protein
VSTPVIIFSHSVRIDATPASQRMFSTLEVEPRYVLPPETHETIYRSFLPQPVEHVMGPRASRLFECGSRKHVQASKPTEAANAECNAGSASRRFLPFTSHLFHAYLSNLLLEPLFR